MSLYRRRNNRGTPAVWWLDVRWRGTPRIQVSTGTTNKTHAPAMLATVRALRDAGRADVLGLLASRKLSLFDVHAAWLNDRARLSHEVARAEQPKLGDLSDEWLSWIETPGALSPRTHRPYSPRATERYRVSINSLFATLPNGRETRTSELTRGALIAFRDERRKDVTGSSINRDLSALQALRRWAADHKGLRFADFNMPKERENAARFRWLARADVERLFSNLPEDWRTFFLVLLDTGMRVGEAMGLTWADVYIAESRISIGASGRVKNASSVRDVPFDSTLARSLADHARRVPARPSDPVFPAPEFGYAVARRVFRAACAASGTYGIRLHDLRHTFAVHAVQAGVPIPRLQRLLGHASPIMTLRYAAHSPEAYFAEDAARIEAALHGVAGYSPITSSTDLKRA